MKRYDVAVLGEILIDFTECGVSESGQALFERNPGGAVANLACAVARLGGTSAFIGKVGEDINGRFLAGTLEKCGVDTSGLLFEKNAPTTLAFVALADNGERSFSFVRKPGADICISAEDLNDDVINNAEVFHVGSLSLTDEPAKSATVEALKRAKAAGAVISCDPNYRASLWDSEEQAIEGMKLVLSHADIAKVSEEEAVLITGIADPVKAAYKLLEDMDIKCIALTMGGEGVTVCMKEGNINIPGNKVDAVDTTGAGDAFFGAFLRFFTADGCGLAGLTLDKAAQFAMYANAAAAVCVTRRGGIPAMATMEETEAMLKR